MWSRKSKQRKRAEEQQKQKDWQYVRIKVEFGEVASDCIKKATWTVPLSKRVNTL